MQQCSFFSRCPSDDEEFPYWTPPDYLEQKFAATNGCVREVLKSRVPPGNFTRNPALDRKLIEAVEHYGSQADSLERTQITRSGDVNVFSLLAKRLWRDVARDIATGITPRQCEERYLQLIASGKWLEQQNTGIKKPPVLHVQPALEPAFVRSSGSSKATSVSAQTASVPPRIQAPAYATAHGLVPAHAKNTCWVDMHSHSDSDGDVLPYSKQLQSVHTTTIPVRTTQVPVQTFLRTKHTKAITDSVPATTPIKRRWDQTDGNLYKKQYIRSSKTTATATLEPAVTIPDLGVRSVRNTPRRTRNANLNNSEHTPSSLPKTPKTIRDTIPDTADVSVENISVLPRKRGRPSKTKPPLVPQPSHIIDNEGPSVHSSTSSEEEKEVVPRQRMRRKVAAPLRSVPHVDKDKCPARETRPVRSAASFARHAGFYGTENVDFTLEIQAANLTVTATTSNTPTPSTPHPTTTRPADKADFSATSNLVVPKKRGRSFKAKPPFVIQDKAPTADDDATSTEKETVAVVRQRARRKVASLSESVFSPGEKSTSPAPVVETRPVRTAASFARHVGFYDTENVDFTFEIHAGSTAVAAHAITTPDTAYPAISAHLAHTVDDSAATNVVVPKKRGRPFKTKPRESQPQRVTHNNDSTVDGSSSSEEEKEVVQRSARRSGTASSGVELVSRATCMPRSKRFRRGPNKQRHTTSDIDSYGSEHSSDVGSDDSIFDTSSSSEDSSGSDSVEEIGGANSAPRSHVASPVTRAAVSKQASDYSDSDLESLCSVGSTIPSRSASVIGLAPTTQPTLTLPPLPPLPPADESLLRSLLPSRHYHKHSINWRFLALVVNKSTAIVRAYARQWRHERRVALLDKLLTRRQRGIKGKCKVPRANNTADINRIKPSKPIPYQVLENSIVYKGTNMFSLTNNMTRNMGIATTANTNTTNAATTAIASPVGTNRRLNSVFSHALLSNLTGGATDNTTSEPVRAAFYTEHNSGAVNGSVDAVGENESYSDSNSSSDELLSESEYDSSDSDASIQSMPDTTRTILPRLVSATVAAICTATSSTTIDTLCTTLSGATITTTASSDVTTTEVGSVASTESATSVDHSQRRENGVVPPNEETDGPLVRAAFAYIATHSYLRSLHPDNWRMEGWGTSSSGDGGVMEWTADRVKRFRELLSGHEEYVDKIAATVYPLGNAPATTSSPLVDEDTTQQNQLLLQAVQKCLSGQLRIKWQYLCSPTYYDPGLLCPVLRNYQWDAVSEAVGWGRAQCQVLYKNMLSGNGSTASSGSVLSGGDTVVGANCTGSPDRGGAPVPSGVITSAPQNHPGLPTTVHSSQGDEHKDKLLLELVQRTSHTYPINLAPLLQLTTSARNAVLRRMVPVWVWDGIAVSVGMTKTVCMNRYYRLVKPTNITVPQAGGILGVTRNAVTDLASTSAHRRKVITSSTRTGVNKVRNIVYTRNIVPGKVRGSGNTNTARTNTTHTTSVSAARHDNRASSSSPQPVPVPDIHTSSRTKPCHITVDGQSVKLRRFAIIKGALDDIIQCIAIRAEAQQGNASPRLYWNSHFLSNAPQLAPNTEQSLRYHHHGQLLTQQQYPWSGKHTPSPQFNSDKLHQQGDSVVLRNKWNSSILRALQLQQLYCSLQSKPNVDNELLKCKVAFCKQAMPTDNISIDASNRSEDDWLVWLVWRYANKPRSATTNYKTTTVLSTTDLPTIIARLLPTCQWDYIARVLGRSRDFYQERYLQLMLAKLADTDPEVASCLLVPMEHGGKKSVFRRVIDTIIDKIERELNTSSSTSAEQSAKTTATRIAVTARRAAKPPSRTVSDISKPVFAKRRRELLSTVNIASTVSTGINVGRARRTRHLPLATTTSDDDSVHSSHTPNRATPKPAKTMTDVGCSVNAQNKRSEDVLVRSGATVSKNTPNIVRLVLHDIMVSVVKRVTSEPQISSVISQYNRLTSPPTTQPFVPIVGLLYIHNCTYYTQDMYPWPRSHVHGDGFVAQIGHYSAYHDPQRFQADVARVEQAQRLYRICTVGGEGEHKKRTKKFDMKYQKLYYRNPLPPRYAQMDANNRNEDDWLVQLVWVLSRGNTVRTGTHSPAAAVSALLTTAQWREVTNVLSRNPFWCQQRYLELMEAKLTSSYPSTASCLLVSSDTSLLLRRAMAANGGDFDDWQTEHTNPVEEKSCEDTRLTAPDSRARRTAFTAAQHAISDEYRCTRSGEKVGKGIVTEVGKLMRIMVNTVAFQAQEAEEIKAAVAHRNNFTTRRLLSQPVVTVGNKLLYWYDGGYVTQKGVPWAGAHACYASLPDGKEDTLQRDIQMARWTDGCERVDAAQRVYTTCMEAMRDGTGLGEPSKAVLRECLESFFSSPIPYTYFHFTTRNRNEDDWLVQLVWMHSANKTEPFTPAPFDYHNPVTAVRSVLLLWQWVRIGTVLCRSVVYCQNRYFELLQARLANRDPAPPPYLLDVVTYKSLLPASRVHGNISNAPVACVTGTKRKARNNYVTTEISPINPARKQTTSGPNNACAYSRPQYFAYYTNATNIVTRCVENLVDDVVERVENERIYDAHNICCNTTTPIPNHTNQPYQKAEGLMYIHNRELLSESRYPWAGKRAPSDAVFTNGALLHVDFASNKCKWREAVKKSAQLITRYKFAARAASSTSSSVATRKLVADCEKSFHCHALPTNYLFMDARNKSEDDWLVWLVWKEAGEVNTSAIIAESEYAVCARKILSYKQWTSIAEILCRNAMWCLERYYILIQAKLTGTDPVPSSYQLVTRRAINRSIQLATASSDRSQVVHVMSTLIDSVVMSCDCVCYTNCE